MILESPDLVGRLTLSQSCALLGVNRGSYSRHAAILHREPDALAIRLRDAVERIVLEFPGYGYRRVAAHLSPSTTLLAGWRAAALALRRSERCGRCRAGGRCRPGWHPGTTPMLPGDPCDSGVPY